MSNKGFGCIPEGLTRITSRETRERERETRERKCQLDMKSTSKINIATLPRF